MPHDSLQRVAGTAVVQTVLGSCTELRQATAPEWSGAAPAGTDVVLHEETVLYEVGIWPDLLVGVARHIAVGQVLVWILNVVVASCP